MPKFFTTTGPCKPDLHYMLPATTRLPNVLHLIQQQHYFVLHAPPYMGKTTALHSLARELTASGDYTALLISMHGRIASDNDAVLAEEAMLANWRESALARLPSDLHPPTWPASPPGTRLRAALRAWAQASPRPLVLFLDDADTLPGDILISLLNQIEDGFIDRPDGFPWSLGLVMQDSIECLNRKERKERKDRTAGQCDGDQVTESGKTRDSGKDCIAHKSTKTFMTALRLGTFTPQNILDLYRQHTEATGQIVLSEVAAHVYQLTQGQPWLVNALAQEAIVTLVTDRTIPITPTHIEQAKHILLHRRDPHLRSLMAWLYNPCVQQTITPLLTGDAPNTAVAPDSLQLVQDLGLCTTDPKRGLMIANPFYQEAVLHTLAAPTLAYLPYIPITWLNSDGSMNMSALLEAFLAFWHEYGYALQISATYQEIAPHLVLFAFVQRVLHADEAIRCEYANGARSMNIRMQHGNVRLAMTVKTWRDSNRQHDPMPAGLAQLDTFLERQGLETGWLIIFDQRSGIPHSNQRATAVTATTPARRSVNVVRAG